MEQHVLRAVIEHKAEAGGLAVRQRAFGGGQGDGLEPQQEIAVLEHQFRPALEGETVGIASGFGDRVGGEEIAAIVEVGDERRGVGAGEAASRRHPNALVLDEAADRRALDPAVRCRIDDEDVAEGEARAVLHAEFLEGEARAVGREADDLAFGEFAGGGGESHGDQEGRRQQPRHPCPPCLLSGAPRCWRHRPTNRRGRPTTRRPARRRRP